MDARYLVRTLRRSPTFTTVAALTLALGIGVTTTVASIADHVLVRGLPFRDSGRLMMMLERDQHGALRTPSAPTASDWQRDPTVAQAFEGITFIRGDGVSLRVGDKTETVGAGFVTPYFFPLLGARPERGRLLGADDHRGDAPSVVVISHRLWMRRFSGDRAVIGRIVDVDSIPTTIVGVLPSGAVYPPFADMWMAASHYKHAEIFARRGLHADSRTMGRLRQGVDSARAVGLMRTAGGRLATMYPAEQKGWMPAMLPLRTEIVGDVGPMLLTLGAAAAAVLLLVCANIASLLLARINSRSREIAVRRALGASDGRIMGQMLAESLILSSFGGLLGVGLTMVCVDLIQKFAGGRLPRVEELVIDWRVLAIAAGATVVTALLCGLWPAIRAARDGGMNVLRASAHGSVGARSDARLRRLLVTVQFALALVLLVGAGLLLQSFRRAAAVNVGFQPAGLVTLPIHPPRGAYATPEEAAALYTRLMEAARAVPGVVDAAFINHVPFGGAAIYTTISIPGRATLDSSNQIFYRTVSGSYLHTMGMSMKTGRWFDEIDMRSPGGSLVINEATARQFWAGQNPVGQHLTVTRSSQARADFGQPITGTVIGVVGDVHQFGQDVPPAAEVYVPFTLETWPWGSIVVRARGGAGVIPAMTRAVRSVDARLVTAGAAGDADFGVMSRAIASSLEPRKISVALVTGFATCALLLAAIGMYGVVAYGVARRAQEIGVRKALGATDGDIASLVFRETLRIVAVGMVLGGAVAAGGARLIRTLLFDTGVGDPATYLVTALVLTGVALLATLIPARWAMRLEPASAMRAD